MDPGTPRRRRSSSSRTSTTDSLSSSKEALSRQHTPHREYQTQQEELTKQKMEALRARLARHERFTVNPNGRFLRRWDKLLVVAIAWTATITPFEIAFILELKHPFELAPFEWARFAINRSIDAIFAADIVLTFFVPFRESPRKVQPAAIPNVASARALAPCSASCLPPA